jgi:transcriptional regulator with XRE-family HTH domain
MKIKGDQTDLAVARELGRRVRRLRLERNVDQRALAAEAGIGRGTLQRLEEGKPVNLVSLLRVLRALGMLEGVDRLVPEPVASPIEQLERAGRERVRARRSATDSADQPWWTWPDAGGQPDEPSG